jgi:hypothetical protein
MQFRSRKSVFGLCLIGLLLTIQTVGAEPVAIVTDLQGTAKIEQSGESSQISILDNLEADAKVVIGDNNALTVVYYDSGIEYTYSGPASFVVGVGQPEAITGNAGQSKELKALENTGLKPADSNVVQAATVFRNIGSDAGSIELISPVNTKMMETSPIFKWVSLEQKTSYDFVLITSRGQTVFQESVTGNEIQLPADVELRNGRKYNWELSATSGGKPFRASASFQVGTQSDIRTLTENKPGADATFSDKIVYAILLKQHGFDHAAQQAWKTLQQERANYSKTNTLFE